MKKIFIILLCLFVVTGCLNKQEEKVVSSKKEDVDINVENVDNTPQYIDDNKTPIGIYKLNGNNLTLLHEINTDLVIEDDIGLFQIFPSNEENIDLDKSFGQSFYDEWQKYNTNNNLKIGFNIKFTLVNGNEIDYNIFNPSQTFEHWEHLMNYLYDDYANNGKSFYSHIEENEYNDNTLFTAFKMQSSYQCDEINSAIKLSVFTYDGLDDFSDNSYRGNSIYTFKICINGKSC